MVKVLKIGGNQLDDPAFMAGLAQAVARRVAAGDIPVIVHGGGKAIRKLQEKFGIQPRYLGGLRVTDEETMSLVAIALCGASNINIVAALTDAGVRAQGYNGADQGLLRSEPLTHPDGDLGRVGRIVTVNGAVIRSALESGIVPVIAPVALALDGGYHNVNADQAAGAVAAGIGADQVVFLTDVPGVLANGKQLESLPQQAAYQLITDGIAKDGMAVKINAALDALSAGVAEAQITNLTGFEANTGTTILVQPSP